MTKRLDDIIDHIPKRILEIAAKGAGPGSVSARTLAAFTSLERAGSIPICVAVNRTELFVLDMRTLIRDAAEAV